MGTFDWVVAALFETDQPTLVLDPETLNLVSANQPVEDLFGRGLQELLGRPLTFLEPSGEGAQADWSRSREALVRLPDGGTRQVMAMVLHMASQEHPLLVLRLVGGGSWATDEARAERLQKRHASLQRAHLEVQAAYNRLELLNDTLNLRNRQLQDAHRRLAHASRMAALGEVSAGMTHGINNPLAAAVSANRELVGLLDELPSGAWREHAAELCSRSERALRRIEGITADLRRLAQAGARRADMREADLAREVRLALDFLAHKLEGVERRVEVPEGLWLRMDPDELCQVLMNLLDNAAYAMQGGGNLWLQARLAGDGVHLLIEDDGPGIPEEVQPHIFEPFYSSKVPEDGSGIGLSVCRAIVEGYSGSLELLPPEGRGARFLIRFPREVVVEKT
jgi:signal transduction histidine kinase